MFNKKYILLAVFLAFSSVLAWFFFYSDFSHPLPIRAKQVFNFGSGYKYPVSYLNITEYI